MSVSKRLTARQKEVLLAYADPWRLPRKTPRALKLWIEEARDEHAHGMRIHGCVRVIKALERKGLMKTDGSIYVVARARLTESGSELARRII